MSTNQFSFHMQFMYTGKIIVDRDQLPMMLKTAVALKIHGI